MRRALSLMSFKPTRASSCLTLLSLATASCLLIFLSLQQPASSSVGMSSSIYVINADGSGLMKAVGRDSTAGAWSPDGSKIAYAKSRANRLKVAVYTANLNGSDKRRISKNMITTVKNIDWSAVGDKLAFTRIATTGNEYIYTMGSNGSGLRRLSKTERYYGDLTWSPDGNQIAYTNCLNNCNLHLINSDGSSDKRLLKKAYLKPSWSVDGGQIAITNFNYDILKAKNLIISAVNKDGSGKRRLAKLPRSMTPADILGVDTTSDFKKIVFSIFRYQNSAFLGYDIYTVNADGSALTRIYKNRSGDGVDDLSWSPDGGKVMFTSTNEHNVKACGLGEGQSKVIAC